MTVVKIKTMMIMMRITMMMMMLKILQPFLDTWKCRGPLGLPAGAETQGRLTFSSSSSSLSSSIIIIIIIIVINIIITCRSEKREKNTKVSDSVGKEAGQRWSEDEEDLKVSIMT